MTHVHVTMHALAQARQRVDETLTSADLEQVVRNPERRIGDDHSGATFYAGENLVLVVRRRRGDFVIRTALTPEMAVENICPTEGEFTHRHFKGDHAWQREQADVGAMSQRIWDMTKPAEAPIFVEAPLVELILEPVIQEKHRTALSPTTCAFFRETRLLLNLSQRTLAKQVGVLRATIKRLECNELRTLDSSVLKKIRSTLQIPQTP